MHSERRLGMLEYGKRLVMLAALVGFLIFTGAQRVRADHSECEHRTERADHRLHEAIEHHGWDSSQAEHARHELREAREYCWNHHHRWWDAERREWREEHNWDDDHGHPQ
jgi:hypothetical protein